MSEDRCAICFDDLEDEYIKTRCGHKFCEDCIKKIEPVKDPNDSKKNIIQCPLCRTPIDIAVRISKNKGKNIPEAISIKQKLPIASPLLIGPLTFKMTFTQADKNAEIERLLTIQNGNLYLIKDYLLNLK